MMSENSSNIGTPEQGLVNLTSKNTIENPHKQKDVTMTTNKNMSMDQLLRMTTEAVITEEYVIVKNCANTPEPRVKLLEKVDVSMVSQILKQAVSPKAISFCMSMSQYPVKTNKSGVKYFQVESAYKTGTGVSFGRLYAYPSLQNCPGFARRLTSHMFYDDIDMENAFPRLLQQVCQKNSISCPHLSAYVSNKSSIISSIMKQHPEVSFKDIKQMFLICMHNGSNFEGKKITQFDDDGGILSHFQTEMKEIALALRGVDNYQSMVKSLNMNETKTNKQGTFISWVCQEQEARMLMAAKAFFDSRGITVGVFVFDGLQIEKMEGLVITPQLLDELSNYCYKQTGFKVTFIEKSMEPTVADISKLTAKRQEYSGTGGITDIEVAEVEPTDETQYTRRVRKIDFKKMDGSMKDDKDSAGDLRCIAINASMNMGKSYQSKQFLRREFAKNPELRVVVICCRIQQANTVMGQLAEFNFQLYSDDTTNISTSDRLVIQYESLYKLGMSSGTFQPFDVLLIDEYRGVCNQITSSTNKEKLLENFSNFEFLHKTSKQVLLLDAFLFCDALCKQLLDSIFPSSDIRYYNYKHISLARSLLLSQSKHHFMDKVSSSIENNKRIAVLFRSKARMKVFIETIKELGLLDDSSILQFDGDTTAKDMQIFQDIDAFLDNNPHIKLMCYTSKVTVGADIQTKFDKAFLHADARDGPCARDCFQMIGRFRNLNDTAISVLLPQKKMQYDPLLTYTSELKRLTLRQGLARHLNHLYLRSDKELVQGKIQWSSTDLMKIAAGTSFEKRRIFTVDFHRLCKDQQYEIQIEICSIDEEVKEEIDMILLEAQQTIEVQTEEDKCIAFESVKRIEKH
jgi:hypothetical protein